MYVCIKKYQSPVIPEGLSTGMLILQLHLIMLKCIKEHVDTTGLCLHSSANCARFSSENTPYFTCFIV